MLVSMAVLSLLLLVMSAISGLCATDHCRSAVSSVATTLFSAYPIQNDETFRHNLTRLVDNASEWIVTKNAL